MTAVVMFHERRPW